MYAAQQQSQFGNIARTATEIQSVGSALGGAYPAIAPEPRREIPREWESVCQHMDYLEAMTDQLINRLSPLLMKRPGESVKGESVQAPIGTVMGNDFYCLSRRISGLGDRLSIAAQDLAI